MLTSTVYYQSMVSSVEAMARLSAVASEQWGLVTSIQARAVDVSPQQLKSLTNYGLLYRIRHGVYAAAGAPESPLAAIRAAWLATSPLTAPNLRLVNPPVIISHRSAALIHDIGDLEANMFEFTSQTRRQTNSAEIKFYRRKFSELEWVIKEGLPITTVSRTLMDLIAMGIDGGHLGGFIRDALRSQKSTKIEVSKQLSKVAYKFGYPLGAGTALLEDLLSQDGKQHG